MESVTRVDDAHNENTSLALADAVSHSDGSEQRYREAEEYGGGHDTEIPLTQGG